MAKYDPNKQYKWEEDDKFLMTGQQFGLILNSFRNYLSKQEAQDTMLIMQAEKAMTSILTNAVEDGTVKELKAEKASTLEKVQ